MKNRYEWNNPKEIGNQKLYDEFSKANVVTKILIYRILNRSRRDNLRKIWDKEKQKQNIESFLNHANNVLKDLDCIWIDNSLKDSHVKNTYELWLICGIVQEIGLLPLTTESATDLRRKDENSFNSARDKMIEWLYELEKREYGMFASNTPLMNELKSLEYKQPSTKKTWELKERERYILMMRECGIGKERANILIKSLEQWAENAPTDRYKVCNFEWELEELRENEEYSRIKNYLSIIQMNENAKNIEVVNKDLIYAAEDAKEKLIKYGIEKEYRELLLNANWNEKQMYDNASIERKEANEYYKFILNRVLNNTQH